jgi:hypothetical protein
MSLKETSYDNALIAVRQEIIAFTSIRKGLSSMPLLSVARMS